MSASFARGACPGLSAPMQTGDGLLVRLTPRGPIELEKFMALCALARRHGNGVMEVTARGNLQVRGLTDSAPLFAAGVAELEIASTCSVPLVTDPLPDGPGTLIDAERLADDLAHAIAGSGLKLAPKVSVAIDGGGRLHLDAVRADIRLRAVPSNKVPRLHVALGGDARTAIALGTIAPDVAVEVVLRLLAVIAARGRARDILAESGIAPFKSAVMDRLEPANSPARSAAEPIGLHPLRDGKLALGVALPFGQADAETLSRLAAAARAHGVSALRPAPGRALLLVGLDDHGAESVASAAERLGLITRADDPRRRIAACAGKPACASAWLPARALAAAVAPQLPRGAGDIALHISGCPKGCAHPGPAALTIVGDARGADIVRDGTASATPLRHVDPDALLDEITRLAQVSEVGHA